MKNNNTNKYNILYSPLHAVDIAVFEVNIYALTRKHTQKYVVQSRI